MHYFRIWNWRNGKIVFNINDSIEFDTYYYINAYSTISDNNNDDFEYISYSNSRIYQHKRTIKPPSTQLIISFISVSGAAILILLIRCVVYCIKKRRGYQILANEVSAISFVQERTHKSNEDLEEDELNDRLI